MCIDTNRYLLIILTDFLTLSSFLHFVQLLSSKIWLLKQVHLFLNIQLPKIQVKLELGVCNSWRAGGQQEGLQYNGEAAG